MNQVSRNSPQQQVAGVLILVMIFSSVLGASGLQDFLWISGISALVAFILLWPRMSRIQHIQCGIFFSVGFIGLGRLDKWLSRNPRSKIHHPESFINKPALSRKLSEINYRYPS